MKPTKAQRNAVKELRRIASDYPENLTVLGDGETRDDRSIRMTIRLPTGQLLSEPSGLALNDAEEVLVDIGPTYPILPPSASVDHDRFAGHPHVLQGDRLCIHLDVTREWHPDHGIAGFLEQLWRFFTDAAAGRFDPATALYHPVGGVLHRTPGTPMIVVRERFVAEGTRSTRAYLRERTPSRFDLVWGNDGCGRLVPATVIRCNGTLRYGAGTTLPNLLAALTHHGHTTADAVLGLLTATAVRDSPGAPLYFVVAVPNPAGPQHLLVGRLPGDLADRLRDLARRHGALLRIDATSIPADIPIEWCSVSDERPEISTRRDRRRPVNHYLGRTVHVWGCGALGSWVAEFLVRAGVKRIVLCDPGNVAGGLLVRQNFTESDVGMAKVEALAQRLRSIRDDILVETTVGVLPAGSNVLIPDADVLIDATANIALGAILDAAVQGSKEDRPLIAQMATDVQTGTLGILTAVAADCVMGVAAVDRLSGEAVLNDGRLERFHALWLPPESDDELLPARGCSTPTFHGSAADIAALSGILVTLLGQHLETGTSGTHLVALPYGGEGQAHHFVPVSREDSS